jgi:hypothetical protein
LRCVDRGIYQIDKIRSIEKRIESSTGIFRFRFYYGFSKSKSTKPSGEPR